MAWIIEGIGAALAIAYLLLALKQNRLCWFAWIASSILYLYVMYQAGLYMESLLQVFYLCMGFFGSTIDMQLDQVGMNHSTCIS